MGSSFLGILEGQAKLLSAAADIMAPLGAYKEVGKGLADSPSSSAVKEATVGWLAAAQVSQSSFSLSPLSSGLGIRLICFYKVCTLTLACRGDRQGCDWNAKWTVR